MINVRFIVVKQKNAAQLTLMTSNDFDAKAV